MADESGDIRLFSPDPRGIIPLKGFHVPHGARRDVENPSWEFTLDLAFRDVIEACADRSETWINGCIMESYCELHHAGAAHSVEVWLGNELAGGLYGVRLGSAFFGESMFHSLSGASKAALAMLVQLLNSHGFTLLDTQWTNPHLIRFGAIDISRKDYLEMLSRALHTKTLWPEPGPLKPTLFPETNQFPLA